MQNSTRRQFIPVGIAVLTVSDTRTEENDKSGQVLISRLQEAGHILRDRKIVTDDVTLIRALVSNWCRDADVQVIITTGGTGVTGRDSTPEAVSTILDKRIEGFGEVFRMLSYEQIGAATIQSRTMAGVSNGRYIFCLPGSPHACATAWDKLIGPQLDYRTRPCNLVELMPRLLEK
ncbi:MAG: molybdenum cofactor biosynthesis protein B [Gammaproteobacteria bacterium]